VCLNPAYITSRTPDVLATNPGGLALYADIDDWPAIQRNLGRFFFLHPAARDFYADWDHQIRGCVARLRVLAGADPDALDYDAMILLDMTASAIPQRRRTPTPALTPFAGRLNLTLAAVPGTGPGHGKLR
jgi:hypothetical protein